MLTLGSGIIFPSLIRAANPSSCENAYADRFKDRELARIEERGRVANIVDLDFGVFVPYFCTIRTLSAIVGVKSSLRNR